MAASKAGKRPSKREPQSEARPVSPPTPAATPLARSRWPWIAGGGVIVATVAIVLLLLPRDPPTFGYEVVREYPHDDQAYTQGLVFEDGVLYESTGRENQSSLRKVNLETGQFERVGVPSNFFAEGIAIWKDRIIQLTWQNEVAMVYEKATMRRLPESQWLKYKDEGWGLTHDGKRLIRSDGSAKLRFHDPETFAELGHVTVKRGNTPLTHLNELEWIDGEVWANVYQTDFIARINPETGKVNSMIDLSGIYPKHALKDPQGDVLNGIAYDAATQRLFVTGKNWGKLFEIRVVKR